MLYSIHIKHRIIVYIWLALFFLPSVNASASVKKADLAGKWYPSDSQELSSFINKCLDSASVQAVDGRILAIISPHAGYFYSAPVAAYGYKLLSSQKISTIVILGISHKKYYDGMSVYKEGKFQTPLGDVDVDEALASDLIANSPRFSFYPQVFEEENSLETQLPFIKKIFPGAKIVPVLFGSSNYEDCKLLAHYLAGLLKSRKDVVVVASTDMSHYKSYTDANRADTRTIELMKQFKCEDIYRNGASAQQPCCGYMPVACALMMAKEISDGASFGILKYANSGDATGEYDRVVGYLSAVIYISPKSIVHSPQRNDRDGEKNMLNETQRKRLLQIARESITSFVKNNKRQEFKESDQLLNEPMGAFVTLHENGHLRGCIGNMIGSGPLYKTVADMAIEAATGDPRFPAVIAGELDNMDIEISVLSVLKRVKDVSQIQIPGNGVIVKRGSRTGVYLPQVAVETGWNREQFLTSLCSEKAGLEPDAWKNPDTELYVFTAEVFKEK